MSHLLAEPGDGAQFPEEDPERRRLPEAADVLDDRRTCPGTAPVAPDGMGTPCYYFRLVKVTCIN